MLQYVCITFSHQSWACFLVFNNTKVIFLPNVKTREMNNPQGKGNRNSQLNSRGRSSSKPVSCAAILDRRIGCRRRKKFWLISLVQLDHQRSEAKILVNKVRLNQPDLMKCISIAHIVFIVQFIHDN